MPIVSETYEDELEIDDTELSNLSDDERENFIESQVRDAVFNLISWGWTEKA
jgi:hypothetical protein